MSSVFVFTCWDDSLADDGRVRHIAASLASPEEWSGFWSDGSTCLAMAEWRSRITEALPYCTDDLVVVADARLDYVPDLLTALQEHGSPRPSSPDSVALIAAAYTCWGEACVQHLEGDYAFVIYNQRRGIIFGARSISGLRPLLFHRTDRIFACASDARQLLALPTVSPRFDEIWLACWLSSGHDCWQHTPYRAIEKLPPGHTLLVHEQKVQVQSFWQPSSHRLRYRQPQMYFEHFRTLLTDAVQSRISPKEPCLLDISGGLDSSSLACLLPLLRQREMCLPPLAGVHGYAPSFPENDDRVLALQAADRAEVPMTLLSYERAFPFAGLHQPRLWPSLPTRPTLFFAAFYDQIGTLARHMVAAQGGSFPVGHLRGDFGDQLFEVGKLGITTLASEHRSLQLFREMLAWRQITPFQLMGETHLLRRRRPQQHSHLSTLAKRTPWLRASVLERALQHHDEEVAQLRSLYADPRARTLAHLLFFHEDDVATCREMLRAGIEIRQPYTDSRLLNFVLTCPTSVLFRLETPKYLLREAMRDLLPEVIQTRRSKGRIACLIFAGIGHHVQELCELARTMPAELEPFLDADQFVAAIEYAARGGSLDQVSFFSALSLLVWGHRLPWCQGQLPILEDHTHSNERR